MNTKIFRVAAIVSLLFIGSFTASAQNTCPVLNGVQLMQCPVTGNCVNNINQCPATPATSSSGSSTTGSSQTCTGNLRYSESDMRACVALAEAQGKARGYNISCSVSSNGDDFVQIAGNQTSYTGTCTINGQPGFAPELLAGYTGTGEGFQVADPVFGTRTIYGSGFNLNSMWYSVPCTIADSINGTPGGGVLVGAATCTSGATTYFGSSNPANWNQANAPKSASQTNTQTYQSTNTKTNTSTNNSSTVKINPSVQGLLNILNTFLNNTRSAYGLPTTPNQSGTNSGTTNMNTGGANQGTTLPPTSGVSGTGSTVNYGPGQTLASTRFIRIETSEMGWISWKEIEVYGKNGAKITPSSAVGTIGSFINNTDVAGKAIDGNLSTAWNSGETNPDCMILGNPSCPRSTRNAYITIDLGTAKEVGKIRLLQNGDTLTEESKIFVSNTGALFTQIASIKAPMRDNEWMEYPTPVQNGTPTLTFTINGGTEATVNTVNGNQTVNFAWNATNADLLSYTVSENGGNTRWTLPALNINVTPSMFDPLDSNFAMDSFYNDRTNYQKLLPLSGTHGMWIPQGVPSIYNPNVAGKSYTITLKAKQRNSGAEVQRSVIIKF